jgi:hypothetical protein
VLLGGFGSLPAIHGVRLRCRSAAIRCPPLLLHCTIIRRSVPMTFMCRASHRMPKLLGRINGLVAVGFVPETRCGSTVRTICVWDNPRFHLEKMANRIQKNYHTKLFGKETLTSPPDTRLCSATLSLPSFHSVTTSASPPDIALPFAVPCAWPL